MRYIQSGDCNLVQNNTPSCSQEGAKQLILGVHKHTLLSH